MVHGEAIYAAVAGPGVYIIQYVPCGLNALVLDEYA